MFNLIIQIRAVLRNSYAKYVENVRNILSGDLHKKNRVANRMGISYYGGTYTILYKELSCVKSPINGSHMRFTEEKIRSFKTTFINS